jgi:hypothetical protein
VLTRLGQPLDTRERLEISFSTEYTWAYNHGTGGHLSLTVIAKLHHRLEFLAEVGQAMDTAQQSGNIAEVLRLIGLVREFTDLERAVDGAKIQQR